MGIQPYLERVEPGIEHKKSSEVSIPRNRLFYRSIYPVHQLSAQEYEKVRQTALRFLESSPEIDPGIEKSCILQFMTSHHAGVITPFYLEHCTIRIILSQNENYAVYSFGMEMTQEEFKKTGAHAVPFSTSILATVETRIGMCDFEEFRPKDLCRVTSIPVASERAQRILQKVQNLSQQRIRFNYIQQNCYVLAQEVMQEAGYPMPDLQMRLGKLLWRKLMPGKVQEILQKSSDCLKKTRQMLPDAIGKKMDRIANAALVLSDRISIIATNSLVAILGGCKMSAPLPQGFPEEKLSQNRGIISFSRLIRDPWSLWEAETGVIHHSDSFIEWQLRQPSTFICYPSKSERIMHILPSKEERF